MARSSRTAHAGLNTVALPHAAKGGPYTAYVRATAPDGAVASDQLDVLIGGWLPTPVARRAIIPLFWSSYDTPPPITRGCRRFGPRRIDCVKADTPNDDPIRHARCTNVVAVVLRNSGYLYLRPYRCSSGNRSADFKRRPRWLARATLSLPLQRIYSRCC